MQIYFYQSRTANKKNLSGALDLKFRALKANKNSSIFRERKMNCTGQKAMMVSDSLTTVEKGQGELKSLTC